MDKSGERQFEIARRAMVDGQLKPWNVTDERVLEAMGRVPRERFVPKSLRGLAYVDEDLEVAPGRYLMEPRVLARLIMAAEIGSGDAVLDIGCATGYSSAVLASLADAVVALEEDADLAAFAGEALADAGIDNVAVIEGRLREGVPAEAPFDVIFVNGAVEEVPAAFIDQLADGGRLVCVLRDGDRSRGWLMVKSEGAAGGRPLFDAFTPLLPGFSRPRGFVFAA
ncbi:MAG: protein-L-isoaspartate O-methyltransferase [Alphaproteobacteria bacterium]|nr:MAG: protein-L-isoaspartate O-methyltransferase [Alphaproteobacteria bacterium]